MVNIPSQTPACGFLVADIEPFSRKMFVVDHSETE